MRPSSVTSPSVSRPFAPCPALLGSGGPVHVSATGHAALPALPHYYGLVCHLAAASRAHFGFPYRTRYRRPLAAGPCEASPGQSLDRLIPCCPQTPCTADSSSMCLRHLTAGSASSAWPTGSSCPEGLSLRPGTSPQALQTPPCDGRPALHDFLDGGCPLSFKLRGRSPSLVASGVLLRLRL